MCSMDWTDFYFVSGWKVLALLYKSLHTLCLLQLKDQFSLSWDLLGYWRVTVIHLGAGEWRTKYRGPWHWNFFPPCPPLGLTELRFVDDQVSKQALSMLLGSFYWEAWEQGNREFFIFVNIGSANEVWACGSAGFWYMHTETWRASFS